MEKEEIRRHLNLLDVRTAGILDELNKVIKNASIVAFHFDLQALDYASSGHTGFASSVSLSAHISATEAHGATGAVVGTTNTQTLTNKTIDADNNTISNLEHGAEVDSPSSGVHGVTGSVVGTTDTQTLTNKTVTDPVLYLQDFSTPTAARRFAVDASENTLTIGSGSATWSFYPWFGAITDGNLAMIGANLGSGYWYLDSGLARARVCTDDANEAITGQWDFADTIEANGDPGIQMDVGTFQSDVGATGGPAFEFNAANAALTGDIFNFKDGGVSVLKVNQARDAVFRGGIGVGNATPSTQSKSYFFAALSGSPATQYGIRIAAQQSGTSDIFGRGVALEYQEASGAGTRTRDQAGGYFRARPVTNTARTLTKFVGGVFIAEAGSVASRDYSGVNITDYAGGRFSYQDAQTGAGAAPTITNLTLGLFDFDTMNDSTAPTNMRGAWVRDLTASSATTLQAIEVEAQDGANQAATKGNAYFAGGDYNTGHIQLENGHIWNDPTNNSIVVNETAPASTTDGFRLWAAPWKDANVGAGVFTLPASTIPAEVNFDDNTGTDTGIASYGFSVGDEVSGYFEMQHDYKEGSDFYFHLHWQGNAAPTGTDKVQWQLAYTRMVYQSTLAPTTTITVETDIDTQYEGMLSQFAIISGTGVEIGDQFMFSLERIAASADEYGGPAITATLGIHYQADSVGSDSVGSKS